MEMKIETIPPYKIAYIRHVGPYGTGNVQTMQMLKLWAASNDLFHGNSIIFGIAHDNPETTKPENCRYDTCLVISENDYEANKDVCPGNKVGGRYSVFKISHTADAVQQAWIEIFPELVKQGCQFDDTRTVLERYAVEMVNYNFCEICVPIL